MTDRAHDGRPAVDDTWQTASRRRPFRYARVGVIGGALSWGVALACWLIVDGVDGASVPELMPLLSRLLLDLGPWTFPSGCVLGLIVVRRVHRFHSRRAFLLELAGIAAAVGAVTGAIYAMTIAPLHPKAWVLATGVPALVLVPVALGLGSYLWRRLASR